MNDNWSVLDIETDGDPFTGRLLCVGWRGKAYVPGGNNWYLMLSELSDPSIAKVVFTKYDHRWLRLHGIDVRGPVIDVQVMAWAVNERTPLDLEWCAQKYCRITMDKRIVQRGGVVMFKRDDDELVPIGEAPIDQMCAYNVRDLEATERLFLELRRLLSFDELGAYYRDDAFPLTETLLDMECRGIGVDVPASQRLRAELEDDIERLEDSLIVGASLPAEFNLGSSKQLAEFLFQDTFTTKVSAPITAEERDALKRAVEANGSATLGGITFDRIGRDYAHGVRTNNGLGLRVQGRTESGKPNTDAGTLRIHYGDNPWVAKYLELASKRTIVNVFLRTIEEQSHDGRLYGRFNQTGTKTGRLSSSSPNLQNIPSRGPLGYKVRQLFVPGEGKVFLHGDYSQLEPRLMAHFSGDPVLRSIYDNDEDIYLVTAQRIFNCSLEEARQYRSAMKTYVLALGYGSGAKTLKRQLAEAGQHFPLHEVESTLKQLKRVYATFFEWKEDVIFTAQNEGYVETLSGHRRRFAGQRETNWRAQGADERQAVNAVIQGSAADIVARAMRGVSEIAGVELLAQVHDELLMEFPETSPPPLSLIRELCETGHGFKLDVPLSFEPRVIASWAEGKD